MNIFLIAVLIILLGAMAWGYYRGFVRIIFSLATMILTIALVSWTTPYVSEFIKENTTIYENLADTCSRKIQMTVKEKVEAEAFKETQDNPQKGTSDGAEDNPQEGVSEEIQGNPQEGTSDGAEDNPQEGTFNEGTENILNELADKSQEGSDFGEILPGIQLPEQWVEQIFEKAGTTMNQFVEESGAYRQVGEYVADWILRGISFFVSFLLISLLLKLVLEILDIMTKLPVIKGVNRLLGGITGLLQGLLLVWLLLFLVAIACTSEIGQTALNYINESRLLTYLYQHNLILYIFNYMFL